MLSEKMVYVGYYISFLLNFLWLFSLNKVYFLVINWVLYLYVIYNFMQFIVLFVWLYGLYGYLDSRFRGRYMISLN